MELTKRPIICKNTPMTERASRKDQGIVLDLPGQLKPDQNFFDQEPFRTVIKSVARKTRTDIGVLRTALHFGDARRRSSVRRASTYHRLRLGLDPKKEYIYEDAVAKIKNGLLPFPRSEEYINQGSSGIYTPEG